MNQNHQNLLGIQLDPIHTRASQVETLRANAHEKPTPARRPTTTVPTIPRTELSTMSPSISWAAG
jgi:hypothetical protein